MAFVKYLIPVVSIISVNLLRKDLVLLPKCYERFFCVFGSTESDCRGPVCLGAAAVSRKI